MSTPAEPQLAPPGAGLPLFELWAARMLFALKRRRGSRETFVRKFVQERAQIQTLVNACPEELRGERVLIRRLRGLEDSSRHWSVWMTLDHLRITNTAVVRVIHALTHGRVPPGVASTAAVKPDPSVTAAVEADYEQSCDAVLNTITEASELKTSMRFAHPWFGPLDAMGWAAMAGTHLGLHRAQIQSIVGGMSST
ncbi:DinB family protein [Prosthecobacter sp.]|uniref:DinB family protein n=1 Tax=Prosthecobacter sp. TaxID=1965333 RepID=UPI0037842F30